MTSDAHKAHTMMKRRNGESDWHVSAIYEDAEITQVVSLRPDYTRDEKPYDGDVVLHALHYDDSDGFAEVQFSLKATEMARFCRSFLSNLDTDQSTHDAVQAHADEDEDEDEDDDDDVDDDEGDDDDGDDDDGDYDPDEDEDEDDDDDDDEGDDDDGPGSDDQEEA